MIFIVLCIISAAIVGLLTGWAIRDSRDEPVVSFRHPIHGAHIYYKKDNRYRLHDN